MRLSENAGKVVINIITAAIGVLVGAAGMAWAKRKEAAEATKKAIAEVGALSAEAMRTAMKKKDEQIAALQDIIKRLETAIKPIADLARKEGETDLAERLEQKQAQCAALLR